MYSLFVTPRQLGPSHAISYSSTWDRFEPEEYETSLPPPSPSTHGDLRIVNTIHCSDCGEEALCCQFNNRGTLLAVGLVSGAIKVYMASNRSCVHVLSDEDTLKAALPVTSLRFYPQSTATSGDLLMATYASGLVKFWHLSTQTCLRTISEDQQTLTSTFNHSGTRFLTAGSSNSINVYDTESKEKIYTCKPSQSMTVMNGHRSRIFTLAFQPQSDDRFISGGWDNTVQFWDTHQQYSLRKIYGPHVCGDTLQINPTTNELLAGSWRKHQSLEIWNPETGEKIQDVPDDFRGNSRIYSCCWLDPDHILAAGSEAHMCRVIDRVSLMTTGCLLDLPGGVYSTAVTSAGHSDPLIAVTSRSSVYFLQKPEK